MTDKKIDGGYIMLARRLIESEIFQKPPLYLKVWIYLLARAQHDDYKRLKRGQLSTSIPEIQEAVSWKVGFRTETPSKNQIFRIINWLRNPDEAHDDRNNDRNMIETTKATHSMLITISNYGVYQDSKNYERNANDSMTETTKVLRPKREANNINKNVNKDNNKDSLSPKDDQKEKVDYGKFIEWFNQKSGKRFKNVESNRKIIRARINEGYSKSELAKVVEFKSKQWKDDPKMNPYLRITTIFAPSHFGNYLNEANGYSKSSNILTTATSDGQRVGKTLEEIANKEAEHLKEIERRAKEAKTNNEH
ncbi:conserved phage C-terminal domain-containing protein [Pediococcus acidilactici]|uniref:conserved phage C-terminal domain-containing protein n=1 Tax=Pediococcus acidilactici TaxID=1254 RepID=UPI002550467B|nr:conserved phage C-terminal domain-containing protein [Pediococcus acidilactici]WIL72586.1 conserved phage C-terminal domain-containing protein [Pediococcus acidilactici]